MATMMMAISRDVDLEDDTHFRYQMPRLEIATQSKGKQTVLVNLQEIADALHRETEDIIRFIGRRVGTSVSVSKKWLRGQFDLPLLQSILQEYVRFYVLCGNCGLPDTVCRPYKSKQTMAVNCRACGAITPIDSDFASSLFHRSKDLFYHKRGKGFDHPKY